MPGRVLLPQLHSFRLRGFEPVFNREVMFELVAGYNLILGGNAIGKTTLVQAVVYGLTGGSEDFESSREFRWSHSYFRGRLARGELRNASIEVEFGLGKRVCAVRRGFIGNHVTGFRGNKRGTWIDEREQAGAAFANALLRYGGYASVDDFAFIIHRLLYLPESRRLLAWDTEAQLRLLMILNQDLAPERSFEDRRNSLQKLDSKKRHTRVAINKAESELTSLIEYDETVDAPDEPSTEPAVSLAALNEALRDWQTRARERVRAEREVQTFAKNLNSITREIEALQEQIDAEESAIILRLLDQHERDTRLPLQKLVERGICPACGTEQPTLQGIAIEHLRRRGCALCGSAVQSQEAGTLTTLRSRMAEKLSAQRSLQESLATADNRLTVLRTEEEAAQARVNELRFAQPVVMLAERHLPLQSQQNLRQLKATLEQQELDLEAQITGLKSDLDEEYTAFRMAMSLRTEELARLYADYATAFLGLTCDLVESASSDNFLDLVLFVPRFEDVVRTTEDSCSEAQRFFLDIAFRMALIDLAATLNGHQSSFVCETPETALDLSYVDNVVQMFAKFCRQAHTLLLTANVQRHGFAELMLSDTPVRQRRRRVLNLFSLGRLSSVQQGKIRKIDAAVRAMMGE